MSVLPVHQPVSAQDCVLRNALDRWSAERPDKVYAAFPDGSTWTYRDFRDQVIATAAGLQRLGVRQGDHVVMWLPNGGDAIRTAAAINYIGAVCVPINVAYRGQLLEHVIANCDAHVMIVHAGLIPRLAEVDLAALETLVTVGPAAEGAVAERFRRSEPYATLHVESSKLVPLDRPIEPWDTQAILYTSGTTGPSKGVLCSYTHAVSGVGPGAWPANTDEDRYLITLPMFHIGGLFIVHAFLCAGASIGVIEGFSTRTFWDDVRRTRSTSVFLLGAMATFLMKEPPSSRDTDHPLRSVFIVPMSGPALGFHARFGVDVYTIFNMTEISSPIVSGANPTKPGVAGRRRAGYDIRLVDENDIEVPRGQVGELMLRSDAPWALNHGYYKNAEATARAWRNGWFHTGDAFRIDADGDYVYVDRLKDVIRRRGENISSVEVEAAMLGYPGVAEAAAVPVPSDLGEDEVMAILALAPGHNAFEPADFIAHVAGKLAHFMVPRYVRVMSELPKTPTAKVRKAPLKAEGVTPDTWDREAAGIILRRERLT